ncbi:MAG TPA: phosphopentomutase [Symbiobacteriaceae bacterium]|jgi:phosphopentomutase
MKPDIRRVTVLVLDGFGIGAMADVAAVRPQDLGANTMLHLAEQLGGLHLPALAAMGLGNLLEVPGVRAAGASATAAWGRCALRHVGADTYAGHQEMAGSIPGTPVAQPMTLMSNAVATALECAHHQVQRIGPALTTLLVDGGMVVADNLEGEAGQNINVTASLDDFTFEQICAVAEIVRATVAVGRVIAVTGRGFGGLPAILANLEERPGLVGVNTALLGIYNDEYRVRHLVLGTRREGQAPFIVNDAGLPVALIGKTADVIVCEGAATLPAVSTSLVLDLLEQQLASQRAGLIFVNVQETDLAGHEQDAGAYARVLQLVDARLGQLQAAMDEHDLFIITADHGNDPTAGTRHTREYTPVLAWSPALRPVPLGDLATLADVGASVTRALGLRATQSGTSFFEQLIEEMPA